MTPGFQEKLAACARKNRSWLCVGLDPEPSKLPEAVRNDPDPVFAFNRAVIDATADLVCCYKPQIAFYEALGLEGLRSLEKTLSHLRAAHPGTPVILDAKRADVPHTNALYAKAAYEFWKAEAVTVVCYLGLDTLEPFCRDPSRTAIVVVRSSNPGARDVQDLPLSPDGSPVFQVLAKKIAGLPWKNVGAVVGATFPDDLLIVRSILPDRVILIPGVGAQGGDLDMSVRNGSDAKGENAVIASSRSVLYASSKPDFADAARREAERLRDAIQKAASTRHGA